ncbi:MAG: DUF6273 domain-containing protein [Raoultibacter sp.]
MHETRLSGWYKDPFEEVNQLRFWDGTQWTDMVQSAESFAQSTGTTSTTSSPIGKINCLKFISGVISEASKLSVAATVILAIAVCVFGQGSFEFSGISLFSLLEKTLRATTTIMIIDCLIGNPLSHVAQKMASQDRAKKAAQTIRDQSILFGETPTEDPEDFLRYCKVIKNCDVASSIFVALIAFGLLSVLTQTANYPWADIATILVIFLGIPLVSSLVSTKATMHLKEQCPNFTHDDISVCDTILHDALDITDQVKSNDTRSILRTNLKNAIQFALAAILLVSIIQIPAAQKALFGSSSESRTPTSLETVTSGDTITFGTTEFDAYAGGAYKKDIVWKVLQVEDTKALIISEDVIELRPYFQGYIEVANKFDQQAIENGIENLDEFNNARGATWGRSSLRQWLNGSFHDGLPAILKDNLLQTSLANNPNPVAGTFGGADTEDKIFLLSIDEALEYLPSDSDKRAGLALMPETNAAIEGVFGFDPREEFSDGCRWWLRTPGIDPTNAAYVDKSGATGYNASITSAEEVSIFDGISGTYVGDDTPSFIGVRPAMWVALPSQL